MSYNEFQNLRLIDAKTFTKATNFRGQFFSALLDVVIQSALVCGQLLSISASSSITKPSCTGRTVLWL